MAGQKGQEQDLNQLLKVRREKLADLQAAGKDPFQITKYNQTHHSAEVKELYNAHEAKILAGRAPLNTEGMDEAQAKEAQNADYNERRAIMDAQPIHVSIAGRMMFKRVMGKASFCNVQDLQGSIQSYVARDNIGEESYADFKKYDVGDILGITGEVFKTKTGEISIHASEVTLLSKSLQVLPEKFHGLTDTDTRYRQRYVDLIMNPEVKDTFIKRSKIISSIRRYLDGQGFMEVETPMLVSNAGGAGSMPEIAGIGTTGRPDLNCCRVIFGEADFLPGITVRLNASLQILYVAERSLSHNTFEHHTTGDRYNLTF